MPATPPMLVRSEFARQLCERCDTLQAGVYAVDGQALTPLNASADRTPRSAPLELPDHSDAAACCIGDVTAIAVPASIEEPSLLIVPESSAHVPLLTAMCNDMLRLRESGQTVAQFGDRLADAYEQTHLLFRLARLLNSVEDSSTVMQAVVGQVRSVTRFGWMMMWFAADEQVILRFRDRCFSDGALPLPESVMAEATRRRVATGRSDDWVRILTPAVDEIAFASGKEVVIEPITMDGRIIGVILAGGKPDSDPDIDSADTQLFDAVADFLGVFHQNVARFQGQQDLFIGTIHALADAIDAKDRYTRGHSDRVSALAAAMAAELGLEPQTVERYRVAGIVHDVGKIGVPEAVLCKPGKLTDEEFLQLKEHPRIGFEMLQHIKPLADILPGVLHHHERWDGRGYPSGLSGEQIPLIARVLALADTYDAMTSNRSYRKALDLDFVQNEFRRCSGTQFDPALTDRFLRVVAAEQHAPVERAASLEAA